MKKLNTDEVQSIHGGMWGYIASAGGLALNEIFLNPLKNATYKHYNKENEKLVNSFNSNPDKFIRENTSFYGD
ncbi:hypothetical protein ACLSZ7_10500 [Avibacterium gallinarum]|uniref:hypothetical protein n=1 Tax=Avibacterium gallinarum TaxID=755 RepID=UPI003BF8F659